MKGLFIPGITSEMFRNGCLEGIVALMAEGKIYDIAYSRWIPLTKRPMTDEEREYYRDLSDIEGDVIFDCPLPEDGQEVLVSYDGYVCTDVFCTDDVCYFEGVDINGVEAWMPLPEPYKAESEE